VPSKEKLFHLSKRGKILGRIEHHASSLFVHLKQTPVLIRAGSRREKNEIRLVYAWFNTGRLRVELSLSEFYPMEKSGESGPH
jgi:hypothetical protein